MGSEERWYTPRFYQELDSTGDSAHEILPLIIDLIKPTSIIDIGCGTGQWLAAALKLGISDVLGVDGPWVLKSRLAIPREKFLVHDLGQPLRLARRFDLAISLEVAEHFPASQARSLVELLCNASQRVLFSAAIPGQGGRHHLNEQWPSYWAAIFRDCGYACYDIVRPRLWQNSRVLWYYAQNCLLFASSTSPNLGPPTDPLPLIHPSLWSSQVAKMNSVGKLLERLPKAFYQLFRNPGRKDS